MLDLPAQEGPVVIHGALTLVFLPPIPWHVQDELTWMSDLVVTDRRDYMMRALGSGCPLLWSGAPAHDLLSWYLAEARGAERIATTSMFEALETGTGVSEAWHWYRNRLWPNVQSLAEQVSQRIRQAPHLADALHTGETLGDMRNVSKLFVPTVPAEE
jgi:hypothetical protein